MNNIIYLEPAAKLGEKAYLFDVNTPNFAKNIMYGGVSGGVIKANFKNLDATRVEVDPIFLDPGRRHFSGYKLLVGSPALGSALSFTEPIFPLAGLGIFSGITSNATKDIYGNPVNLSSITNTGAYNGSGEPNAPILETYEAESGIIVGGSEINCSNGSGGKAVNIGSAGQTLTFNIVNVSNTDLYLINVFYANPLKSTLKITVNGGNTESIILPYSDAYCYQAGNPTSFPIIRALNSGSNTIMFEQGIIDKIEIVSVNNTALSTESEAFLNKSEAYLEKSIIPSSETIRLIINKEMSSQNVEISIFDINGSLIIRKNLNSNNMSLEANQFGTGMKILVAKVGSQLIVKKFIVY